MRTTSRRVTLNALFNVAATVGRAVIGFFLVPFLLSSLGTEAYGVWILIGSALAYAPTLQLGMASAINRHIPVSVAREERDGIDAVMTTGILFSFAIGVLVALVALVVHRNLEAWFTIPADLVGVSETLVLVVGTLVAVSMPLRPYGAVLSGLQRYGVFALGRFLAICLRTVVVIWALTVGHALVALGWIYGGAELLILVIYAMASYKLLGRWCLSMRSASLPLLGQMLGYGINVFLFITSTLMLLKGSEVILGVFLTPTDITGFSVMMMPLLVLTQLLQALTSVIKPAVSDMDARGETDRVRVLSKLAQKYSLLLLLPIICFLVVAGGEFLAIWVGPEFARFRWMLAALAVAHLFRLSQFSNFLVMVGKGEHKVFGVLSMLLAGTALLLGAVAVGGLGLGLWGVVAANIVPMIVVYGVVLPAYYSRHMGIPLRETARSVLLPALAGSMPSMALTVAWWYLLPPDSWGDLVVMVAVVAGFWLVTAWTLGLKPEERLRLLRLAGWGPKSTRTSTHT